MAKFDNIWNATKAFEGGYQAMVSDPANYCPSQGKAGSQLIGTNHGISAIGKAHYDGGKCPTVAQMKALSVTEAKKIAKAQYWDPIKGDKINSQAIAHLIFDFTYGGKSGTLQTRQAINAIKGKGTVNEYASFDLSDNEIALINSIPEKQLFDKLIQIRKQFYVGHTYQTGLTNRLNDLQQLYVNTVKNTIATAQRHLVPLLIIGTLFSVGLFLVLKQ